MIIVHYVVRRFIMLLRAWTTEEQLFCKRKEIYEAPCSSWWTGQPGQACQIFDEVVVERFEPTSEL